MSALMVFDLTRGPPVATTSPIYVANHRPNPESRPEFRSASRIPMTQSSKPKYRRILLKLSGEALGGESGVGICPEAIHDMARQIGEVRQLGVEVVIVVGGGRSEERRVGKDGRCREA